MNEVFFLIRLLEFDLVVAGICIQERQQLASGCRVYDLVDARQSEGIFRACFVETSIVDTHAAY